MTSEEDRNRLEELAVSRLLEPLSSDEAEEYAALEDRIRDFDADAIESVVALAHVATLPPAAAVPRELREAVEQDAAEFFGNQFNPNASARAASPLRERARWVTSAGWCVGLAASLVTIVVLMRRAPVVPGPIVVAQAPPPASGVIAPAVAPPAATLPTIEPPRSESAPAAQEETSEDLAAERRSFVASHPHAIQRAWRAGGDPTGERVAGDVVWDAASQTGFMRLVNLRRNEPNAEQYQLWIFDAARDQRFPIDGGLFDVTSPDGEQIIRIHAKLRVRVPLVFAVTVEHPGGVVVSDRSRIAAIANVT